MEAIRAGNIEAIQQIMQTAGLTFTEALGLLRIDIREIAPAFGVHVDNLNETTVQGLRAMAEQLGMLPLDLAEHLGIPLSDLAEAFGYELGVANSDENRQALRTLAQSLGVSLITLGRELGEEFSIVTQTLSDELSSVFTTLPPNVGPSVREHLNQLLNNVATAANPREVEIAVDELTAFTRDNLPASFALALEEKLRANGLLPGQRTLTDVYSILETINNTLLGVSGVFRANQDLLTQMRNSQNEPLPPLRLQKWPRSMPRTTESRTWKTWPR